MNDDHGLSQKSTVDQIRRRFDGDVERFSNLETGQEAAMDAPLMMDLTAKSALAVCPRANRLLDIGCGAGNYTLKLLRLKTDINCDLVDLSASMLDRAQQRVAALCRETVQSFEGDIREVELPGNAYDIIIAASVLHHLRDEGDWYRVFAKLYDLCAPEGSLWIIDLISQERPDIQDIMEDRYGRYLEGIGGTQYRRNVAAVIEQEDSPRSLPFQLDLLREVGFAQVEILHKNACYAAFGAIKSAGPTDKP